MLALKEFADFVTLNMANLATTFSRLLAEQSPDYAAISPDSRTATGRKLLNAVSEACQEQTSDPLVTLFKENTQQSIRRWPANITPSNPLTEVECLGQTLTPVVTNLEAGKFLWQMLAEIRADLLAGPVLLPKAIATTTHISSTTSIQDQQINLVRVLVDNMPDIIFMKDVEGHFLLANDALRRQLGAATVQDVIGKTDYDFNPKELADQYRADDLRLIESGKSLIGVEEPIYDHETGITGWVSTTKIPFTDDQGDVAGVMGVVRDITDLKTAQLTLSTRIKELNYLNELGRQIEEAPLPAELLEWTAERLPAAMQHPEMCEVAITFEDVVYGDAEAIEIPSQMTHGLYIGGQVQGRVYVAYTKKQDFLNEESALLGAVATRISVFLENQKLFNDMQDALAEARTLANEQTVLTELGQALTAQLNVEQILEETYKQASRLVDTTNFYIGLYNKKTNQISFSFDVTESEVDKSLAVISADEGLAGYIVKNRTPLLFEDNVAVHEESLGISAVGQEPESWLGVPLMIGDEVLGVMAVQSYITPRLYTERDRDLLTAIANQVAVAVQNARRFEETQLALAEVKESQQLMRNVIDATPDWIFVKDRQHRYHLVNNGYANTMQLTVEEFIGKDDLDVGFPEDIVKGNPEKGLRGFWPDDDEVMNSGQTKIVDVEPAVIDGKQIYLSTIKVPLRHANGQVWGVLGYVRDITERQNLLNETQTLYEASAALSASQSYNELLKVVRDYTIADQAQSVSIGYFEHIVKIGEPMPSSFDILASWRPGIEEAFRVNYTLEEFPSLVHLIRSELTVVEDISQETFVDESMRVVFEAAGAKTVLYAPIAAAGQWIGFLSFIYQKKQNFSEVELQRVTAITTQLSSALQNLYNYQETEAALVKVQKAQREAQILQQLGQALAGTLETKEVIDAFFNAARQLLGIDFSVFSLVDKQQHRVLAVGGYNVTDDHIRRANHPLDSTDIMADIIRTGQTELIRGGDDPRFDKTIVEAEGMQTWGLRIFTPITVRQENIGLVEVGFRDDVDADIEETQVQFLQSLIDQVAVSLDNAQRYQASQQTAHREQAIREITEKMRAVNNLQDLVETTAKELGQHFSAQFAFVDLGVKSKDKTNGH